MPLPAKLELQKGEFMINESVGIKWKNTPTDRLKAAEQRLWSRVGVKKNETPSHFIEVAWDKNSPTYISVEEDESYQLEINANKVRLTAKTSLGVLRGFETLTQLGNRKESLSWPACTIEDKPRYPWRGLMLDVSRHWMPKEVIYRTLDGMAAVKMNVFHWHLTDDQGFRIESKTFPKLHELGSNGNYYTQEEIREIIEYAAARGIRIIPEFDVPGHTTSWLVGYPKIGSGRDAYELPDSFAIKAAAMNPTLETTYEFLDTFLQEMTQLFPDEYLHIGGDEVNPEAWKGNEEIQAFISQNNLEDEHGLQAYFNQRIYKILQKHGKKMMGWDEILHPDLPQASILIQAWRSHTVLFEVAHKGYTGILSNGWYLDHKLHAEEHYAIHPNEVRGGITIEPDSIWTTYEMEMSIQGNTIPTQLTLFGESENLRGVWGIMNNLVAFEHATFNEPDLVFQIETPMGTGNFESLIEGDSISGKVSLALLNFNFEGKKIGGYDMANTSPPELKQIPVITDAQRLNILGGEACMWSEVISSETVDSRLWPRTAAIAEKLWTPEVLANDPKDMYRRLDTVSKYLTNLGLTHETYRRPMLEKIAPNSPDLSALEVFVDILEETKYYQRLGEMFGKPLDTPLQFLADAGAPESRTARIFSDQVDAFLADSTHQAEQKILLRTLRSWEANNRPFVSTIMQNPELMPYKEMSSYLAAIARIGMKAVHAIANGEQLPEEEKAYNFEMLDGAEKPVLGAELAIVPAVRRLVEESYR